MKLLVCPVCKSTEIEFDAGGYTGKYFCKNCGYVGSFVIEMTEEEYKELTKQ
ncbi:MAG: TFIIB-type zinc ribbon-containing protein [Archaeoglobaceae archaeon]|nr:TFIIB-type zinc ribbon-containing protein [Archaeoglobaceae archaeon]